MERRVRFQIDMIFKMAFFLPLFILACSKPTEQDEISKQIPDYTLKATEYEVSRNGLFTLVSGKKYSGYLEDYYPNGQLKMKAGYLNGLREGKAQKYYSNGALMETRYYADNKKHGRHRGWWANGNQKFDYYFVQGEHEGIQKEWFNKGNLFKQFTYRSGKEEGTQKMWEASGKIRANYVVKNGRRYGLIGLKNCKSVNNEKGIYTALIY
ncbi:MAG: toxin-antitoxin system YwqK family antitoxin [Bacteroidota bacterium]